jgi:hypothetical protein
MAIAKFASELSTLTINTFAAEQLWMKHQDGINLLINWFEKKFSFKFNFFCSQTTTFLVDATWSLWSSWSNCSMICSTGNHTRTRSCNTPRFGGFRICPKEGDYYETQNGCNTQSCPCEKYLNYIFFLIFKLYFLLIFKLHFLLIFNALQTLFKYF